MGLFGDIDVSEVPEDPFWVDNGTYLAVLTELKNVETNDGRHGLAMKWVIQEEDSEFNGSQLQDWKNTYPDLTEEDVTPEIKKDLSRLKQRLVQIGVTEEDQQNWDEEIASSYIGTEAYLTVKNSTNQDDPSKKYRNITFVRLPE
jgi:hypothetical protein